MNQKKIMEKDDDDNTYDDSFNFYNDDVNDCDTCDDTINICKKNKVISDRVCT